MIEISMKMNAIRLKSNPAVHLQEIGQQETLCGISRINQQTKTSRVEKTGETPTCRNCWGHLYLMLSVEADDLFDYPKTEDVEERVVA